MELPATGVPIRLTAEQVREQARQRWFNTAELCEIFAKHDTLNIHISQPQERPTNGAFFAIHMQRLREFRKDGHVWAKKKDRKTIQESHENLKVGGVGMLNCLYAYGEKEKNFQRRIYRMIKKEHGDIVIFHYRKIENQENWKIWRRGIKPIKVTPQPSQETEKVIPTMAVTASSSVIVDHSSNQLSLPSRTANTDNLNIQKNVESAGCSQLQLAPKTADTGNQNSIQAIAQPSGSSLGIFNHENYQLPLPPNTTGSGTQSNIQGNAESAGDVMLNYDSELKNQSFPQETKNDFFTNLSYPAEPGSLSDLPELMNFIELTSQKNSRKKITKVTPQPSQETEKVIPTLAVTGSSSVIVDHSSNQLSLPSRTANTDNLNIQKNVESAGCSQSHLAPKTTDTGNQNSIQASAQPSGSSLGIVYHENYQLPLPPNTTDSELKNQSFPQETENDLLTNLPSPGSLSDLSEWMKDM